MKSTFSVHLLLLLSLDQEISPTALNSRTRSLRRFVLNLPAAPRILESKRPLRLAELRFQILRRAKVREPPSPFSARMSGREIRSGSAGSSARTMRTDCGYDTGSQRSSYCDNTRSCCIGRRHAVGRKVRNGSAAVVNPLARPRRGLATSLKRIVSKRAAEERDSPCTARSVDNDFATCLNHRVARL